jgi:hypothetical protein
VAINIRDLLDVKLEVVLVRPSPGVVACGNPEAEDGVGYNYDCLAHDEGDHAGNKTYLTLFASVSALTLA